MSASQAGHCNMVATDDDLWLCFSPSALEDAGCAINKGEEVYFGWDPNWYLCPTCFRALVHRRLRDPRNAAGGQRYWAAISLAEHSGGIYTRHTLVTARPI